MKTKKRLLKEKITENVGKLKEVWKAIESLGLPS